MTSSDNPKMYILAGPNGSGKSTVLEEEIPYDVVRLNSDRFSNEIAGEKGIPDKEIQKAVNESGALQIAGGKRLSERIKKSIQQKTSFSAETTLATKAYIGHINNAKSNGFEAHLLYVGTESPKINAFRVAFRVKEGGHDIPPGKIKSRYDGSLERLSDYIAMADKAKIYDNSIHGKVARHILSFEHGKLIERNEPVPDWVKKHVLEKLHTEQQVQSLDPKAWGEEVGKLNLIPGAKIYPQPNEQVAYTGEILHTDAAGRYCAQKVADKTIVLHDARKFTDGLPPKGAVVKLNYREGKAAVSPIKEKIREQTRGRGSQSR